MGKKVAILATLDTKGTEALYIKNLFFEHNIDSIIIDLGILNEPIVKPDVSREEVLKELDIDPKKFAEGVKSGNIRRDEAIRTVGLGAAKLLIKMLKELNGVIGIGGNQGTAAASIAMKALPIGFPKLLVSTVASGNIRPYVEYKDILMMFSVADLEFGPNTISKTILRNAVNAMVGLVMGYKNMDVDDSIKRVAVTTLGSTGRLTRYCITKLKELNYEPIVFHASGSGGSAMEELIEGNFFHAVLDLNLHELVGEVIPDDIYKPMKPRLINAIKMELPLVLTPGSINYLVFGPPDSIPSKYLGRKTHYHNPYNTNVRLLLNELISVAEHLSVKLSDAKNKTVLILPMKGFSVLDMEGGPLYQPEDDMRFIEKIKKEVNKYVGIVEIAGNINDYEVACAVFKYFKKLVRNSN
ncbi:MAG: Tm-1-like ATP-binding domain-containing protein [Sulfolobales archaeon]